MLLRADMSGLRLDNSIQFIQRPYSASLTNLANLTLVEKYSGAMAAGINEYSEEAPLIHRFQAVWTSSYHGA